MKHVNEDELVLYYYGEGRNRTAIERHLAECGADERAARIAVRVSAAWASFIASTVRPAR